MSKYEDYLELEKLMNESGVMFSRHPPTIAMHDSLARRL